MFKTRLKGRGKEKGKKEKEEMVIP